MRTGLQLAAICFTVLAAGGCAGGGPLVLVSDQVGDCKSALDANEWRSLSTEPTEFGLDGIEVRSATPVRILSARLVGGNGHLRLAHLAFVPGGPVGGGFPYADGARASTFPAKWALRQEMPGAVLTELHATRRELKANPSAETWQLVVGVVPTTEDGTAAGVQITYAEGRGRGTLTGQDFMGVSRFDTPCTSSS